MTPSTDAHEPFFSPGVGADDYRGAHEDPEAREHCEALWRRYRPLNGDPNFLSDARNNFHARAWEMILTCDLFDRGLPLVRPPADGPDIQIAPAGERPTIWIEVVTVELGTGGDYAGRVEYQKVGEHSALFRTKPERTALRYTSAIAAKARQREAFIARGIVQPNDIFIVAINGANLHDHSSGDMDPEILKAVYPLGEACVTVYQGADPPRAEWGHRYRGHVAKASGTEIPTDGFMTGAYAGVSAVLYSRAKVEDWNRVGTVLASLDLSGSALTMASRFPDDLLTIHNQTAATPLPVGFFNFGCEFVAQDGQIRRIQHPVVPRTGA